MKVRLFSDTHREFGMDWFPDPMVGDKDTVLVLAGDIDVGPFVAKFMDEQLSDLFKAVIHVPGNHEFYGFNLDKDLPRMHPTSDNCYMLYNDSVTIDGVEFIGTTLWTDYDGGNPMTMMKSRSYMADGRAIRMGECELITSDRIYAENQAARSYLSSVIDPDKDQVVITHHVPSYVANKGDPYAGQQGGPFFYNTGMDAMIQDSKYWFFGHTHHCVDIEYLGCRIVANAVGYPGEYVAGFNPDGLIELTFDN